MLRPYVFSVWSIFVDLVFIYYLMHFLWRSCFGRFRWAFLCADGGVLAWEQGMVRAERAGAAVSADQSCLRFDHPTMARELAAMKPLQGVCEREYCT